MEKFVKFWGGIWEKDDRMPEMPQMKSVIEQLRDKITSVIEFKITLETLENETKERKNWTAPVSQNEQVKGNNDLIPFWWSSEKTELLPQTKDLTDEKNYRPLMCLNTSYKFLTGLVGKYMREHTIEINI